MAEPTCSLPLGQMIDWVTLAKTTLVANCKLSSETMQKQTQNAMVFPSLGCLWILDQEKSVVLCLEFANVTNQTKCFQTYGFPQKLPSAFKIHVGHDGPDTTIKCTQNKERFVLPENVPQKVATCFSQEIIAVKAI